MKQRFVYLGLISIISCHGNFVSTGDLQSQIDSLKEQVAKSYKPGLGEFMSSIQVHHEKLWFAGNAQNWRLADFEIHEIGEAVDDIKTFASSRSETKYVTMLEAPIDSLSNSIRQRNLQSFKQNFILLTNTCNNCHAAVEYNFNKIKIPDTPPFSNQVFKIDSIK